MKKPALLVLAAGLGSRFGGLKQMAGLGPKGEVLLEYSVHDALKAGFDRVVFIIRKDIEEDFKALVVSRLPKDIPVDFVFQEMNLLPDGFSAPSERTKPWGTAHALWCARNQVDEHFAVLNADDFYGFSGFKKLADFFNQLSENKVDTSGLVGFRLGKTISESGSVARGICKSNEAGFLVEIEERTDIQMVDGRLFCDLDKAPIQLSGAELVSMNFWGFSPAIFKEIDALFIPWLQQNGKELKSEFLLPMAIGDLVKAGKQKVKVLDSEDEWIGVTYANDKELAATKLAQLSERGVYPSPLW